MTDKEIAKTLYISPKTVETHLRSLFQKIGASNRTALVAYAVSAGVVGTRDEDGNMHERNP